MKFLGIGINDYPGTNMDLRGCVNDVNDMAAELKRRGVSSIKTLFNDKATHANIVKAMTSAVASMDNELLIVHYSGHGSFLPDQNGDEVSGNDSCWCPHDVMTAGPIIDDTIYSILRKKPANSKIVVFSDSCFSGTVMRSFGNDGLFGTPKFMPPIVFRSKYKIDKTVENIIDDEIISKDIGGTMVLLSGCSDTQTSMDAEIGGRSCGAFTYFLLRALREMPNNMTYKQLFKRVRMYLPCDDYPQAPNLYGKGITSKIFM
jgi:hypothetical protein